MRKEERECMKDIQLYLNQKNETGIKVDDKTVIHLKQCEKKITRRPSDYRSVITEMLRTRGVNDKEFVDEIIKAKTDQTIKQQKLTISKSK